MGDGRWCQTHGRHRRRHNRKIQLQSIFRMRHTNARGGRKKKLAGGSSPCLIELSARVTCSGPLAPRSRLETAPPRTATARSDPSWRDGTHVGRPGPLPTSPPETRPSAAPSRAHAASRRFATRTHEFRGCARSRSAKIRSTQSRQVSASRARRPSAGARSASDTLGDPAVTFRPRQRALLVVWPRCEVADARPRRRVAGERTVVVATRVVDVPAHRRRVELVPGEPVRHRNPVQRRIASHAVRHRDRELAAGAMTWRLRCLCGGGGRADGGLGARSGYDRRTGRERRERALRRRTDEVSRDVARCRSAPSSRDRPA